MRVPVPTGLARRPDDRGRAADDGRGGQRARRRAAPTRGELEGILALQRGAARLVATSSSRRTRRSSTPASPPSIDGTQVKVVAWYDNEWGYSNRLVDLAQRVPFRSPAAVLTRGQPRDVGDCPRLAPGSLGLSGREESADRSATTRSTPASRSPLLRPERSTAITVPRWAARAAATPSRVVSKPAVRSGGAPRARQAASRVSGAGFGARCSRRAALAVDDDVDERLEPRAVEDRERCSRSARRRPPALPPRAAPRGRGALP